MNIELLIKYFIWLLCSSYIFIKVVNYETPQKRIWSIITGLSIVLTFLLYVLRPLIPDPFRLAVIALLCSVFMWLLIKRKLDITVTAMMAAVAITAVIYILSGIIAGIIVYILINEQNYILVAITLGIQILFSYLLFRIKRFRKGFPFLYKKGAAGTGLIISGIALTLFALWYSSTSDNLLIIVILSVFLCAIGIIIWVRRNITAMYIEKQKKKLIAEQQKEIDDITAENLEHFTTIKEFNNNLAELERCTIKFIRKLSLNEDGHKFVAELSFISDFIRNLSLIVSEHLENTASNKATLVSGGASTEGDVITGQQDEIEAANAELFAHFRINHAINHKKSQLEMKTANFYSNLSRNKAASKLFAVELSDFLELIKKIYHNFLNDMENKTAPESDLPKTGLRHIDDIFDYMHNEAAKSGISFQLNITYGIKILIENFINENKLQTLISDHIKDAIIAIRSKGNGNGIIIVNMGMKRGCYEFSVADNGVPFDIDTLLSLGKKAITTHANTGGSGMGFMTTFETMRESNASLIITELADSKTVKIRFDNENQYIIHSYRANETRAAYVDDGRIVIN